MGWDKHNWLSATSYHNINMPILIILIEITERGRITNRTQEKSDAQYNCSPPAYWGADQPPSR